MAKTPKYDEPYEDVQKVFDDIIAKTDLGNYVSIRILTDDKMKKIGKVVKATDLIKHIGGDDVIIIINQEIFDQLPENLQVMQAEELLSGISFNTEKDKLEINKGDVDTYSGVLRKYGYDVPKKAGNPTYEVLIESIKTLYEAKKQKEE